MTEKNDLSVWSLIKSGLAAMFGVQSEENRERDFKERKPGDFILIGVILLIVFVSTIYLIVASVLKSAGV